MADIYFAYTYVVHIRWYSDGRLGSVQVGTTYE